MISQGLIGKQVEVSKSTEVIVSHETLRNLTLSHTGTRAGLHLFMMTRGHTFLCHLKDGLLPTPKRKEELWPPSQVHLLKWKIKHFRFPYFSWVQEGGCHCRAWESATRGGQMVYMLVSELTQIFSHVWVKFWSDRETSSICLTFSLRSQRLQVKWKCYLQIVWNKAKGTKCFCL